MSRIIKIRLEMFQLLRADKNGEANKNISVTFRCERVKNKPNKLCMFLWQLLRTKIMFNRVYEMRIIFNWKLCGKDN
jgi:hypothetical protein